jgi:hypothetical protein
MRFEDNLLKNLVVVHLTRFLIHLTTTLAKLIQMVVNPSCPPAHADNRKGSRQLRGFCRKNTTRAMLDLRSQAIRKSDFDTVPCSYRYFVLERRKTKDSSIEVGSRRESYRLLRLRTVRYIIALLL